MARLHLLVENDDWATLGAALEGLEIQTIAGREALLLPVETNVFNRVLLGRRGDGRWHSLLVARDDLLVVVHGGQYGLAVRRGLKRETGGG